MRKSAGDSGDRGQSSRAPTEDREERPAARGQRHSKGIKSGRAPSVDHGHHEHAHARSSDQACLRHATATAYRCFLPDLTGFTDRRCTGPDRQRHATHAGPATPDLGREFSPAGADCGYRAPLAPRLARPCPWYPARLRRWRPQAACRRRQQVSPRPCQRAAQGRSRCRPQSGRGRRSATRRDQAAARAMGARDVA